MSSSITKITPIGVVVKPTGNVFRLCIIPEASKREYGGFHKVTLHHIWFEEYGDPVECTTSAFNFAEKAGLPFWGFWEGNGEPTQVEDPRV